VGAMVVEEEKIGIKKFISIAFRYWKMQIEDILYRNDPYQPFLGEQHV
jgi:hypothetical protein